MRTQMMYQVDAFASALFTGNPAAVCILDTWLPEQLMQSIAAENNLAETAFAVAVPDGYEIRWFTPETEVALCGHATLATAHILFETGKVSTDRIQFASRERGLLHVSRDADWLVLDFPADPPVAVELPDGLTDAIGASPEACFLGQTDYLLIYSDQREVDALNPDFFKLNQIDCRGVIASAPGEDVDFVSRFFAPRCGVPEDPVTGSAHTLLIPYWHGRLGKTRMMAHQRSKRGGALRCEYHGDRVHIGGQAVTYMKAELRLPDPKN
ncbi:PhzF family phenazine biosynthesis protein [Robiginitalea sp.]|uniref:PhzF family phenazine biosynthesis protein n=1 Tax=Robiginitalea sp. TaxID=1902411 RepID=UPI003C725B9F